MSEQGIVFPRDAGEHWGEEVEWWYLNAHVITLNRTRLSLFISFLRDQMLLIINDLTNARSLLREVVHGSLAHTSTSRMDLHFGESWWRDTPNKHFGQELHLVVGDATIDLHIDSLKPPLLINRVGRIKFGLLGSSWYYSLTRLSIRGILEFDGRRDNIEGVGWFDRQWGTWESCGIGGWQWFSLQLDNDTEILFMKIKHPLTDQILTQILNIVPPDSNPRIAEDCEVKPLRWWKSSSTGVTYEMGWLLRTPSLSIKVTPCLEDQEVRSGLWEGPCLVEGYSSGHIVTGVGFAEQYNSLLNVRGYAKVVNLGLAFSRYVLRTVLGITRHTTLGPVSRLWKLWVAHRTLVQKRRQPVMKK